MRLKDKLVLVFFLLEIAFGNIREDLLIVVSKNGSRTIDCSKTIGKYELYEDDRQPLTLYVTNRDSKSYLTIDGPYIGNLLNAYVFKNETYVFIECINRPNDQYPANKTTQQFLENQISINETQQIDEASKQKIDRMQTEIARQLRQMKIDFTRIVMQRERQLQRIDDQKKLLIDQLADLDTYAKEIKARYDDQIQQEKKFYAQFQSIMKRVYGDLYTINTEFPFKEDAAN